MGGGVIAALLFHLTAARRTRRASRNNRAYPACRLRLFPPLLGSGAAPAPLLLLAPLSLSSLRAD